MNRTRSFPGIIAALLLVAALPAAAHPTLPKLNAVYPCGARQGTVAECIVVGGDLEGLRGLLFSHPGITATLAGPTAFKVMVGADVPVGRYDVWAVAESGVSNFRSFVVCDLSEVVESEPNNEPGKAQLVTLPAVVNGRIGSAQDVDHFTFAAKKGQRILLDCYAARLDSQLDTTMAVSGPNGERLAYSGDYHGRDPFLDLTAPADGNYTVRVWDFLYAGGGDFVYRIRIGNLPYLDAVIPAAVKPGTRVTLTLYGRNLPGSAPDPGCSQVDGRPLEVVTRTVDVPADGRPTDGFSFDSGARSTTTAADFTSFRLVTPEGSSNPVPIGLTDDPIVMERKPDGDDGPQLLPVPCEVSGTFSSPGERDMYRVRLTKGEKIVVEVVGERLNGVADPRLTVTGPDGQLLLTGDDAARNVGALRFPTNHRDPIGNFIAASDGEYKIGVRDLYFQRRGDVRFTYRLSVRRPRPDFRLVAVPANDTQPDATVVGRGGRYWMDVLVQRQDGYEGEIRVEAEGLPDGVTAEPVVIGPGKVSAPLVLTVDANAQIGETLIRVVGRATIDGRELVRTASGGGLIWGTTETPGVARTSAGPVIAVRNAPPFVLTAPPDTITVQPGGKASVTIRIARAADWTGPVQLTGFDTLTKPTVPPMEADAKKAKDKAAPPVVDVDPKKAEGTVEIAVPENTPPGSTYSITINGTGQAVADYGRPGDGKGGKSRRPVVKMTYPSNPITVTVAERPPAEPK